MLTTSSWGLPQMLILMKCYRGASAPGLDAQSPPVSVCDTSLLLPTTCSELQVRALSIPPSVSLRSSSNLVPYLRQPAGWPQGNQRRGAGWGWAEQQQELTASRFLFAAWEALRGYWELSSRFILLSPRDLRLVGHSHQGDQQWFLLPQRVRGRLFRRKLVFHLARRLPQQLGC